MIRMGLRGSRAMPEIVASRCRAVVENVELRYATLGSAGFDLFAALEKAAALPVGGRLTVPTGFCLEIPAGFEGQIRSRSGLAQRNGVVVLNSPGTIDSDYRGEISVVLANFGSTTFIVAPLARIAQMVIAPVVTSSFTYAVELSTTSRGVGGFGSTGMDAKLLAPKRKRGVQKQMR